MQKYELRAPSKGKDTLYENTFVLPVIYNYDGVARCIETIHKYNEKYRIVLIDQTPDNKCWYLRDKVDIYLKVHRNLGFAKAMNIGAKMATTPYITLCNDDIEFISKRWFPAIRKLFDKAPNLMAINPASVKEIHNDRTKDWMPYKEEYTDEDYEYLLKPKKGFHPTWIFEGTMMFCTVFRKEAFEVAGWLDEGFYPGSGEDYDWCRRCYELGYKLVHYNGSFVYHHWLTSKNKYNWNNPELKKYRVWEGFREKWMTDEEQDPDIYGRKSKGLERPTIIMDL
jgi:GT2 family glycosyltransferase